MNAKRSATETSHSYGSATNSFSSIIDDELRRKLVSVGPRARKIVSEGGYFSDTSSIPAYTGLTTGTLDQEQLRKQYLQQMAARPMHTTGGIGVKRTFGDVGTVENDDDGGDTDVDDDDNDMGDVPSTDINRKVFYRPNSHRSFSSQQDDFEEAEFLRPR